MMAKWQRSVVGRSHRGFTQAFAPKFPWYLELMRNTANPTDRLSPSDLRRYIRDIPDFPKPGIIFRDITPLLADAAAFQAAVSYMAEPFRGQAVDAVAAAEARGFVFAAPLALELNAGFVPIRKPGKLPYERHTYRYALEYGEDAVEMHRDAIAPGARVLLVDDVLATGGTMHACCQLVEQAGGEILACVFLLELGYLHGRERLSAYPVYTLLRIDR
jgi:adenine phosphoribosyltransferase